MEPAQELKTLRCAVSEGFASWMASAGGSVAISTYQAGRIVLLGWNGRQVSVLPRELPKPMGLATGEGVLAVACRDEVAFFANAPFLAAHYPEPNTNRYDALYLPRASYNTGDVSLHDLAFGPEGLWAVNTRFSCLAVISRAYSFLPKWKPPFISQLAPEDRCHLNGLAMIDGRPGFVTAHSDADAPGAWRQSKAGGGVLMDVASGEFVLRGLYMPHSPRMHKGRLWFLNSGQGELCLVDPAKRTYQCVAQLPGYARGLCFVGKYALVGLSKVRSSHVFEGMPVQARCEKMICGVAAVDLATGKNLGAFEFSDGCDELYDVHFLPGPTRPGILNMTSPAAKQGVSTPDFAYWLYEKPKEDGGKEDAGESGHVG